MHHVILEYGPQRYTIPIEQVAQVRALAPWLVVRSSGHEDSEATRPVPRLRLVRAGDRTALPARA
jgi:hypothetical protein